jgi:hypothetical protein
MAYNLIAFYPSLLHKGRTINFMFGMWGEKKSEIEVKVETQVQRVVFCGKYF